MNTLDRAREYFAKDRFATDVMGIQIDEVETGRAVCSLTLNERHYNAENIVMGGVIFTLADLAFAVAANLDRPITVTLTSQIAFLSPPRGNRLVATAQCVRQGHTTCHYHVTITDGEENIVASVAMTGFVKH